MCLQREQNAPRARPTGKHRKEGFRMKHVVALALTIALLLALAIPAQASYSPVTMYLNSAVSTRSGPSTDFNELGTYFSKNWNGVSVKAFSKSFANNVWWVQIEFSYGGTLIRVYTGEKRFKGDAGSLPVEASIGTANVNVAAQGYYGPGTNYKQASTVPAGTSVTIYDTENGYAQVEFKNRQPFFMNRVWIPISSLNWSGSANYDRGYSYVTPTPTPTATPYTDWSNWNNNNDWNRYYTGAVNFTEGDNYTWTASSDLGFTVISGVDLNGCALLELTILGEITYHNVYLFMSSATSGTFVTFDGKQGSIDFYDNYAILRMDLNFADVGTEFMMVRSAWK